MLANFKHFDKDENLNKRLVKLWTINNKIADGEDISDEEREYFNTNLLIIQTYYTSAGNYWSKIQEVPVRADYWDGDESQSG